MKCFRFGSMIVVCSLGCASGPFTDVSGTWSWSETVNSSSGFTCQATGEMLIAQFADNNRFSGQRSRTATCPGAPDGFSIDGAHAIISAEVKGTRVTFEVDFCSYEGMLTNANEMSGTFLCPNGLGQEQFVFDGTWRATRS